MRYKAEIFDYFQYLYHTTGFSDHQLHCVIQFEGRINAAVMEAAVRRLVETVPILSRVYRNHNGNSYWEDASPVRWTDLFAVTEDPEAFERFTCSRINEETGPQVKVCLLRSESDSLSVLMNHMVADGAGMKQCVYLLAEVYSRLLKDPDFVPDYIIDGDRSFSGIVSGLRPAEKIRILLFNRKDNNQGGKYRFPMSTGAEASPFILTREILPEVYDGIRDICKQRGVTVNDVILAAYFRVLSTMLHLDGKPLHIPIMIDMRRYLKDNRFNALSNLSSTVILRAVVRPGEDFYQTLAKVHSEMEVKKKNSLGLNTFLKLDAAFAIFKSALAYRLLARFLKNPHICMTNIGVLDSEKLIFEDSPVSNAYISGSIKYRPHFQLAVSSYRDKMTFSINLYGDLKDRSKLSEFLSRMDGELKAILELPCRPANNYPSEYK
jgi:NRPS condensation-like uncharacterized protein